MCRYLIIILLIIESAIISYNQSIDRPPSNNEMISANSQRSDRLFSSQDPSRRTLPGMDPNIPVSLPMGNQYNTNQRYQNPHDPNLENRIGTPIFSSLPFSFIPPLLSGGFAAEPHIPGAIGDSCLSRIKNHKYSCENALMERQRDTRNGRTAQDIQRRLCCSLYFYHDCLTKVVIQNCRDASPIVVNLVMDDDKRRELAINCRSYTRDQCNASSKIDVNNLCLFIIILICLILYH